MPTTKAKRPPKNAKKMKTTAKRKRTDKLVVYWEPGTIEELRKIAAERGLSTVSELVRSELFVSLGLTLKRE